MTEETNNEELNNSTEDTLETTSEKILYVTGKLSGIKQAINDKGGEVTDDISNYAEAISNIQTSSTWGSITGTLSNQTDLNNALEGKYDASNPDGYITGITSSDVATALGFTPYNSTNPDGFTGNEGTITGITMNGVSKGTSGVVDLGDVITDISSKQDTLVSGTNIKTINNESILGNGNISVEVGETITMTYDNTNKRLKFGRAE